MTTDALEWHDGVLEAVHIHGAGEIHVTCDLYSSSCANNRVRHIFSCVGVTAFSSSIDFQALVCSAKAGNITNGRIVSSTKRHAVLKLFLVDGYIEISAKKIKVASHCHDATTQNSL